MFEPRAIIADDEELIRADLRRKLARLWPELVIVGEATSGDQALEMAERLHPEICFLDIRMPGLSGLEVGRRLADSCRVVFITAFDQYAVEAFQQAAVDYLLKPVSEERLGDTVQRLKRHAPGAGEARVAAIDQLLAALSREKVCQPLAWLKVQDGEAVKLIAVAEVFYFQAEDKYTTVVTGTGEWLIRKSIKELAAELDGERFWRIHRGTIVNVARIEAASRNFSGVYSLKLKGLVRTLTVSRGYAHLFKQM
ncbi:MAG: response regulator transcription factor [Desulfobulbaceae bacterium]|nr:response regulator transcription factor [Desulfobulbaceae bacterium]